MSAPAEARADILRQLQDARESMNELMVDAIQLAQQAKREGVADLRASGLRKVKAGVTSLDEINRVTKD